MSEVFATNAEMPIFVLSRHKGGVMCGRAGCRVLYTASNYRTARIWDANGVRSFLRSFAVTVLMDYNRGNYNIT